VSSTGQMDDRQGEKKIGGSLPNVQDSGTKRTRCDKIRKIRLRSKKFNSHINSPLRKNNKQVRSGGGDIFQERGKYVYDRGLKS